MKKENFRGKKIDWETFYCFVCERQFKNRIALASHLANGKNHQISWKDFLRFAKKNNQYPLLGKLDFHLIRYPIHPVLDGRRVVYPPACGYCLHCGKKLSKRKKRYCSVWCREFYKKDHHIPSLRLKALINQDFRCICGKHLMQRTSQLDHKKAISLGGSVWDSANHQALCYSCHLQKSRRDFHQFKTGFRIKSLDQFLSGSEVKKEKSIVLEIV